SPALDACLHGAAYCGIAPGYRARGPGFLNEGEKGRAARIDGMKTMAKAGDDLAVGGDKSLQCAIHRTIEIAGASGIGRYSLIELHALLARTTMNVPQHIDRRGHHIVQIDAGSSGNAGDSNRGRMWSMVYGSHQGGLQKLSLLRRGQIATQHQPDHLRKADLADQILDGVTAHVYLARTDVDNIGRPPCLGFRQ